MEGCPGCPEVPRVVARVDLEAPRQAGRLPEQLLIPPVADAPDGLGHEQPRCKAVGEQRNVRPGPLRDHRADDAAGRDSAPDTEAALPDRERTPPLVGHLVPAGRDVIEPRSHDPRADTPDGAAEDQIPVAAAIHPAGTRDPDTDRDCREQRQPVHVHGQRPEVEGAVARGRDRGEKTHDAPFLPQRRTPLRRGSNE